MVAAKTAKAEEAVAWGLIEIEKGWQKGKAGGVQSALVSLDPRTGGILAYVGGRDYGESQFDRVSQAARQAGSAFKPVVFAAAFEDGLATPATFMVGTGLAARRGILVRDAQAIEHMRSVALVVFPAPEAPTRRPPVSAPTLLTIVQLVSASVRLPPPKEVLEKNEILPPFDELPLSVQFVIVPLELWNSTAPAICASWK